MTTSYHISRRILLVGLILASSGIIRGDELAGERAGVTEQKEVVTKPAERSGDRNRKPVQISPSQLRIEWEESALRLVRLHHPELEKLLRNLRAMDPIQYWKTIHQLARTEERLAELKARSIPQYEVQLALWKATSRAQLLSARAQLNPNDSAVRQELEAALSRKIEAQKDIIRLELERLEHRRERLQANLERLEKEQQTLVERQMRELIPVRKDPAKKVQAEQ